MQRSFYSLLLLVIVVLAGFTGSAMSAEDGLVVAGVPSGSSSDYYHELIGVITADWQKYGELFTNLQSQWFWKVFLGIMVAVPAVFLLHYLIIGPKHFDHDGPQIYFFSLFARIIHFIVAVSFTLIMITGLLMIFGKYLGGGAFIRGARYVHLVSAIVFVIPALLMFFHWVLDMFPKLHDIKWVFILGGYLSKKKKPVPAGKYNAGQKMYFWCATFGGLVMAYTGYVIWGMSAPLETVQMFTIVHNVLGMVIFAFFLTHVYMSVFAIAGSLQSMKTGYKSKDEVDILHSKYNYQ